MSSRDFMQEPAPQDPIFWELAREYYMTTEEFDIAHCSGPILQDGVMPATNQQRALSNQYAMEVKQKLAERANFMNQNGRRLFNETLRDYCNSSQFRSDMADLYARHGLTLGRGK